MNKYEIPGGIVVVVVVIGEGALVVVVVKPSSKNKSKFKQYNPLKVISENYLSTKVFLGRKRLRLGW